MNYKTFCLLACTISLASLTGCQKKEVYSEYLKPELVGTIYDRQTNKPISKVQVFQTTKHITYTENNGYFNMPAFKYEYYSYDPQLALALSNGALILSKKGYATKNYPISNLPRPLSRSGQKEFVDMGNIYMTPVPIGQEHELKEELSGLPYCKPQQSQKEVDCIPVPKGYKYEELTNLPP